MCGQIQCRTSPKGSSVSAQPTADWHTRGLVASRKPLIEIQIPSSETFSLAILHIGDVFQKMHTTSARICGHVATGSLKEVCIILPRASCFC